MNFRENLKKVLNTLPENVQLVAVSKTKPVEYIREVYGAGQRVFGENRPQEMAAKHQELPSDVRWHMIGQLQEKNVKYIAGFVDLIHSVDSLKVLARIDREAAKHNRIIDCLLEFHIAREETKAGLKQQDAEEILESEVYRNMRNVRIVGVMGVATYTEDKDIIREEFRHLKEIFNDLKRKYFSREESFKELSMGMSGDYQIAVSEGSTLVRVGSAIFGEREYQAK